MTPTTAAIAYGALAFGIGCTTGLAEILPRYRDDPLKAAFCLPGVIYWLLNGLLSVAAFAGVWLLTGESLGLIKDNQASHMELMQATFMAGFGAMTLVRAKLFKVTLANGSEVSVGPEHIINVLFDSTNAYIAKKRAWDRTRLVEEKFADVRFPPLRERVITLALTARQSLSLAEQSALGEAMGRITADKIAESEKSMRTGYLLLDYVGESFLSNYNVPKEWKKTGEPTAPPAARAQPAAPEPAADETEIQVIT